LGADVHGAAFEQAHLGGAGDRRVGVVDERLERFAQGWNHWPL
jgi:hypothetical protein